MWKDELAPAKKLWSGLFSKLSPDAALTALLPIWNEEVGDAIRRISTLQRYSEGELWVMASTPSWARELASREHELLEKLTTRLGCRVVSRIHFYSV